MTKRRNATSETKGARRLKVRKETIKDLDAKGKRGEVKGGATLACRTFINKTCGCPSLGCLAH